MSKRLYREMKEKQREILCKYPPTYIYQCNFNEGTLMLSKPGYYKLRENIVFKPNPCSDYFPRSDQKQYNTPGFLMGFFAVICIYGEDIYLELDGFTISASEEFILQQRFFSIIELANSPFIFVNGASQGPGAFSTFDSFRAAKNVIISGGILGRNSHHCVHGSKTSYVLLEDLVCEQFEFVGVAINGSENLMFHRVDIRDSRKDIPVLATYSAARFARLFARRFLSRQPFSLPLNMRKELIRRLTLLEIQLDETFSEIMSCGQTTNELFRNDCQLPDGNVYGLLVKNNGFAVNELESSSTTAELSSNVFCRRVSINNIEGRVDEILGLSLRDGTGGQVDVAGAVLQIDRIVRDGKYHGNVLSDLQLYLAEISLTLVIPIGKTNITFDVINWSKGYGEFINLMESGYKFVKGTDSMLHINKSVFAFRIDAINNFAMEKCSYDNIRNVGRIGITDEFEKVGQIKNHDLFQRDRYCGADTTGISISYCKNVSIENFKGYNLFSRNGNAIGISEYFGSTNIRLDRVKLKNIKAGNKKKCDKRGKPLGENYYGKLVPCKELPRAIGIRYEKRNEAIVEIKDVTICNLSSPAKPIKIETY